MSDKLNKLTGKEWLQYSFSIWRDIQKNNEERTLKHPAMFPIMLVEKLLDIYTNSKDQIILDPFMGSGTTLIAAQNKGLKGIGFEINKQYISMAKNRIDNTYNSIFSGDNKKYEIFGNSAENIEKYIKQNSVDLTITSPPYWDVLNRTRTADHKSVRNYGNSNIDLGNIEDYNQFLSNLQNIFKKVYQVTKPGRYCIVIVMDIRKNSKLYLLHSDLIQKMNEINFSLSDIFIWDRQKEYNYPTHELFGHGI